MENYKYIELNKFWFVFWLVISLLFVVASFGTLFLMLLIPLYYYLVFKTSKYYYNDEKLILETGIISKRQKIVPFYRIVNITAEDNILNFGKIYIRDKEQLVILSYVDNSKKQMLNLIEKWETAKKDNIRNEVI